MTSGEHQMARMGQEVRPVPRIEIVHTPRESVEIRRMADPEPTTVDGPPNPQPWHARQIHANGEPGWSTETYVDEDSAFAAIVALARTFGLNAQIEGRTIDGDSVVTTERGFVPIVRVEVWP